jgi:hypothetical protein
MSQYASFTVVEQVTRATEPAQWPSHFPTSPGATPLPGIPSSTYVSSAAPTEAEPFQVVTITSPVTVANPSSPTAAPFPSPAQTASSGHHAPIGPIVAGSIAPALIFLIVIVIYFIRRKLARKRMRKRVLWISPWISSSEIPSNPPENKRKIPFDPETRLLSQVDATQGRDDTADHPEDLSPPPFPTDSPIPVANHDKENRLRNFILRACYGPPSEPPSVGPSEQPPPY